MTHDWSHLDEVASSAMADSTIVPGCNANTIRAIDARIAILSALTPSDLAALLAEKCPNWVAVPKVLTTRMENAWGDCDHEETARGDWGAFISAAPKLGEDN